MFTWLCSCEFQWIGTKSSLFPLSVLTTSKTNEDHEMRAKHRNLVGSLRFALYARVSTDDQADRSYPSVEAQLETLRNWVSERGGTVVGEYKDEAVSGTKSERPSLSKLIRDLPVTQADVVLTTALCRLGRGGAYHVIEDRLTRSGVSAHSIDMPEENDFGAKIQRNARLFMNGVYVDYISDVTKKKMEKMVRHGYVTGCLPFGFKRQLLVDGDENGPKIAVPDPYEAPIVAAAFDVFLQHRTVAAVRDYLKECTAREWTSTTTKNLLRNRAYIGVQSFGEWINESAWEPVIEREVFEQAQQILASKGSSIRSPRTDEYTYLLRDLVWCPFCECRYTPSVAKGGQVRYYECLRGKKKITSCPVGRVNSDALHQTIIAEIARHAEHQTVMHRAISESHAWEEPEGDTIALRAALAEQRRKLSANKNNFLKAIEMGRAVESILVRLEQIEHQEKDLNAQIAQVDQVIAQTTAKRPTAAQVQAAWASAVQLWRQADDDQKQTILRGLVQRVEMRDKDRAVVSIAPFLCSEPLGFGTTENLGAGTGFEPVTSGL